MKRIDYKLLDDVVKSIEESIKCYRYAKTIDDPEDRRLDIDLAFGEIGLDLKVALKHLGVLR
jgi:hypothetical protein